MRQQTWEPRSLGVSKQAFFLTLGPVLDTLRHHGHSVFLRCSHRGVEADADGVEGQLRGLADRRARVEAELVRATCEETFSRRQQRLPLHGILRR